MSVYHNGQKVLNNITSANEEVMKEIAKEVYSTEEQVVGTWIDGKPIYRKVIDCGALPNATAKEIPHGITNLDMIINMYGTSINTSNIGITLPFATTTPSVCVDLHYNMTYVRIVTGTDLSNYTKTYVTIEYTKN